jgi:5-methyltetrahydropteroyltriglutamate--homocysteine methyltransferase
MKAKEFEQAFNDGVDITASLDLSKAKRALLTPDCGFATFADNPLNSDATAEAKMAALASATRILRERHHIA